MTDQPESPPAEGETAEAIESPAADEPATASEPAPDSAGASDAAPAPAAGRGGLLPLVLSGIALAVAAGAGIYAWQMHAQIDTIGRMAAEAGPRITKQEGALRGVQELAESLRGRTNALAGRQDGIEQSLQTLAAEQQSGRSRIAYNDVRELLLAANHRMVLARDFDTATTALQMADERLKTLADPAALELRRQIAEDLSKLRTSTRPDIPGLSLRLAALSERIDDLPLATDTGFHATPPEPAAPAPKTAEKSTTESVGEIIKQLGQDLSGLVRIQPLDTKQPPLLPPEQRYFLRENLRLTLSGAQVALLRGAAPTYRNLIATARTWIERHFNRDSEAVKGALAELDALEKANIEVAVVDISGSLKAVDAILQSGNSP